MLVLGRRFPEGGEGLRIPELPQPIGRFAPHSGIAVMYETIQHLWDCVPIPDFTECRQGTLAQTGILVQETFGQRPRS